jgi:hypothetical protein
MVIVSVGAIAFHEQIRTIIRSVQLCYANLTLQLASLLGHRCRGIAAKAQPITAFSR